MRRHWLLLMFLWFLWLPTPVSAADSGYVVRPVPPATQQNTAVDYFDVQVTPGHTQSLSIQISNPTKQSRAFIVSIKQALTAPSGFVAYGSPTKVNWTGKTKLSSLLTGPHTVTVASGETATVTFSLTPPRETFAGVISGAIVVTPTDSTTSAENAGKSKKAAGITINNRFSTAIPVLLRSGQKNTQLPSITLTKVSGAPLTVTLANPSVYQFGQLAVTLKVTDKAGTVAWHHDFKDLSVAPTSRFTLALPKPPTLKAGQYTLKMTATSGEYTWQAQRAFKITTKQAATAVKPRTTSARATATWWWLLAAGLAALFVAWFWWQGRRHRHAS